MEKRLVIKGMLLKYDGLFSVLDLYKIIDDWLKENGYDKVEKENIEYVKPEGKYIEMRLEPYRKVSDYVQNRIVMKIIMTNIKEVDIDIDRKKRRLNKGEIAINFDAYLETDYAQRWEQKPVLFFIRTLVDKYVYKIQTQKFEDSLKTDTTNLHTAVKSFLNLYRY
jgi:hypothetical protein